MNRNDIGELIRTVAIVSVPIIEYFGLNKFNDSYMEEKGRNLATKEDVQELTSLAEEIKLLYQSKQHQNENIYNIKKDTILESLDFLDDYLSWLSYETNIIPIRNDINESELTLKARKCYNNYK